MPLHKQAAVQSLTTSRGTPAHSSNGTSLSPTVSLISIIATTLRNHISLIYDRRHMMLATDSILKQTLLSLLSQSAI